ncbi:hypothetical protein ISF_00058 [Cordyceps fumosorosea ARSEF 2679]|uniref:Uncharacterized protein n=1 Tax=Cordyceps fumosorosea (strain ARSEF 2679) TaxID=1081104 RepID=A0A168DYI3_CORFA|nr:hypothetical protein ISF_00058 [Cordyceps fumosorosea ARSEF 2679]OAA73157.1 hypothetical protein ISF_00058 [Cordyceps fumosorosea ARSEF 2679]
MCKTAVLVRRYMCDENHTTPPEPGPMAPVHGCGKCGIVTVRAEVQGEPIRRPCLQCEPEWEVYEGRWMRKTTADRYRAVAAVAKSR